MISTKFYSGHDEEVYLGSFAEDGNMGEDRLKQIELEFLCAVGWNIYISNEQFFSKLTSVEKLLAKREGLRRGWLTYTELIHFLPSFALAKFLLNNITVLAVSYAASVITIAGAFFLASQIPGNALHHGRLDDSRCVSNTGTTKDQSLSSFNVELSASLESGHNVTCAALNVEVELQGLEYQYIKEQYLGDIGMRNNENAKSLLYSHTPRSYVNPRHHFVMHDVEMRWYNFKDEYRDDDIVLGCSTLTNFTKSMLWNLFADAEHSFVKFPFLWFKFI